MTERDRITAALTAALLSADLDALRDLAAVLAAYKTRYPASWQRIQRQPFCWGLVDAIEQALELALECPPISGEAKSPLEPFVRPCRVSC